MKNPPPQRDSTISAFTNSLGPESLHGVFSSSQKSFITNYPRQTTLIGVGGTTEHEEGRKEKKTKLRQMYKRATMSTKALARMFSRSPGPGRGSPNGGITKRSSLKTPISITPPLKELLNVDPFASGSSVSSYGLSPLETKRPSLAHKRTSSSPEIKPHTSEREKQLKRFPSVSSPLSIPASPLSTLPAQQSQDSGIRGRDSPFPINSSNISLPLPALRTSASSQSLVSSTGTQATVPIAPQNQTRPPIPHVPSSTSLRAQARQTPPNPAPEQSPPGVPSPPPFLTPAPVDSSGQGPKVIQRLRSQSVRETQRYRPTLTVTEPLPQPPVQRLDKSHGDKHSFINREMPSFLDIPPSERPHQDLVEPNASVRVPEIHVIALSPSVHSLRASFLASDPTNLGDALKRSSRAGSISAEVARRDLGSSPRIDSWTAENQGLEFDRLPELIPQYMTRSTKSSRGPSPTGVPTPPATERRPSLPLLVTQNLPPVEDPELRSNNLRPHHSTKHIPRSPSMPSLRPDFTNFPPLMQGLKIRFGTPDDSHIRSPSLPDVTLNAISSGNKETRQPLPPSITELLRTRTRRSGERQPHVDSLSSKPRPLPSVKKSLEPLPSALTDGSTLAYLNPEGSALSTASTLQTPPPPKVSHLLRKRSANRPQGSISNTPSMPDLRQNSSINGSRSRRLPSPPPLPATQHRPTLPLLEPNLKTGGLRRPSNSINDDDIGIPTVSGSLPGSPLSTAFSRPKLNSTRSKESFSYPPSKNTVQAFHTHSNNEFAQEGSPGSLAVPPRPPRSPATQTFFTHVDRKPSFDALRSRSNSVKVMDRSVPPVPATQVWTTHSQNRMVGMAL